jgi:GNAT superfamily N-acetyltransferase
MALIRKAEEKDIPSILELYQQLSLAPENYRKAAVEDCRHVLEQMADVPGYHFLVIEDNGEVIGTTVMVILPAMAHGTSSFAVIEYVVVDEKHRNKGIGKILMEYCQELAKKAGCYKIMLTSDHRREDAHRFYESLGFEASARGFRYYF